MKNAKKILIIAVVLGFIGFILFYPEQEGRDITGLKVGAPAPNVKLSDLKGRNWDLSELRGSVVIVIWDSSSITPIDMVPGALPRFLMVSLRDVGNFRDLPILVENLPALLTDMPSLD